MSPSGVITPADIFEKFGRHVSSPYVAFLRRMGLHQVFVRARQALVYDSEGREYIDCIAGYGNLNLGHNPPAIIKAVVEEIRSQRPFNWPFVSDAHASLAERLANCFPGKLECCLVVNSGAEAVDSALKLVRLATRKTKVISMNGAWHGFTFGALSISEASMCRCFQPLLEGITHVPYGDARAVEQAIDPETGAVFVEPIQAESGAVVPPPGYLQELAEVCRRRKVLLVFDEIKTGIGKTGRLFACEHEDVVPDILLAGKSLGGGLMPIGVVLARRNIWGAVGYSFPMSSSSGSGNAPACAAALATLDMLARQNLCARATLRGQQLASGLRKIVAAHSQVAAGYSGRGLLMALQTDNLKNASAIVTGCIKAGVLIMMAFCDKTRILIEPPLCITEAQMETVISTLGQAVKRASAG